MIQTQDYCSNCHKIWTLETGQGVCTWCGKPSNSETRPTHALRKFKSSGSRRGKQALIHSNGYDHLEGEWGEWYKVAALYARKVPPIDQEDVKHDILIELAQARRRDGVPIPELRAYRIASLTVALYWRKQARSVRRVCTYNGYATEPHCQACRFREQLAEHSARRCPFVGVRPTLSLDSPSGTIEGLAVSLKDTLASEHLEDMPPLWYEAKTWLLGCPIRLIQIAGQIQDGEPLSNRDRNYLFQARRKRQKELALSASTVKKSPLTI